MKRVAQILLFVFITFLITPSIISVLEKNADISVFYNFSEEEKAHKEIKALINDEVADTTSNLSELLKTTLIQSENLSKHDKITSKIFIPPPENI
ncbi:hypothetical protein [Flavobacterium eburneipallidum]|uniref:hypothetical protein n=1 Tax=Flavobacterium eburneipallidum TaxID=3003263 RepID=UPI0022ABD4A0|nr:hypothetical protein [Flavobacterium eburneipallidum]